MFTKGGLITPLMIAFDSCDTTEPVGKRDVITVAPQALALLNNEFVHQRSEALSRRVIRLSGNDPEARVRLAWRFALGRDPTKSEMAAAQAHLGAQRNHFTAAGRPAEFGAVALHNAVQQAAVTARSEPQSSSSEAENSILLTSNIVKNFTKISTWHLVAAGAAMGFARHRQMKRPRAKTRGHSIWAILDSNQ